MSTTNPDPNKRDGHHVATGTPRPLSDSFRASHESASTTNPDGARCAQASVEDIARGMREHYESVSSRACDWMSTIPKAIDTWEREQIAARAAPPVGQTGSERTLVFRSARSDFALFVDSDGLRWEGADAWHLGKDKAKGWLPHAEVEALTCALHARTPSAPVAPEPEYINGGRCLRCNRTPRQHKEDPFGGCGGACMLQLAAPVAPEPPDVIAQVHAIANKAFGEGNDGERYEALREILDLIRAAPVAPERPADLACEKATWAALIEYLYQTGAATRIDRVIHAISSRALEIRPQFAAPVAPAGALPVDAIEACIECYEEFDGIDVRARKQLAALRAAAPAGRQDTAAGPNTNLGQISNSLVVGTAAGERDAAMLKRVCGLIGFAYNRLTDHSHAASDEYSDIEQWVRELYDECIVARLRSVALPNAAVKAAHVYLDSTPESFGDAEKLRMHLAAVLKAGSVAPAAEPSGLWRCGSCGCFTNLQRQAQCRACGKIDTNASRASQPVAVAPSARFAELAYMEPCKKGGQHSWFYRCDKCAVEVLGTEWDDKPGAALAAPAPQPDAAERLRLEADYETLRMFIFTEGENENVCRKMQAVLDRICPVFAAPAPVAAPKEGRAHVFADGYCVRCYVKLDDATEYRPCPAAAPEDT